MATPQPPKIPEGLTAAQEDQFLQLHGMAHNLKEKTGAVYLSKTASRALEAAIPAQSYDIYLQSLMTEAGNPSDPIERMMIEQIAIAHHNIGRLHVRAA